MSQSHEYTNKVTPEYWGGYDIMNEAIFVNEPYAPEVRLTRKEFTHAQRELRYGVGQVAAGNATEIKYQAGNVFDPPIEDGSLVVVDAELVTRWTHDDPSERWDLSQIWDDESAIARPYSDFWLAHQDYVIHPTQVGSEAMFFRDRQAAYVRMLQWGIIMRRKEGRAIQPFPFDMTKLLPSGKIYTPPIPRRDPERQEPVISMPVNISEVRIRPRLTVPGCVIDSLDRIRSVDVVYPASGARQSKQGSKRGWFGLPRLGTNPA